MGEHRITQNKDEGTQDYRKLKIREHRTTENKDERTQNKAERTEDYPE